MELRAVNLITATTLLVLGSGVAFAAPPVASDAESELQEQIDQSLDWYELAAGSMPLKPLPVLRWDNNTRGSQTGLTALYVGEGRPEAIVCIYPWEQNLVHEFASLSRGPLTGRRDSTLFWQPQSAGVQFRAIPDAEPPSPSRAARLLQMKSLARRFGTTLVGWRRDDSDRQELRLMPRPLHRYEKSAGEVIDGAVFSFAMGTDPEVVLLIEAVENSGEPRWEYAFARRTSGELQGRLDGEIVWTAARFPVTSDPAKTDRNVRTPLSELVSDSTDLRKQSRPSAEER